MPIRPWLALIFLCLILCSCGSREEPEIPADGGREVEAVSLLGRPLERPLLDSTFKAEQERLLAQAKAGDQASTPDALIWQGRHLAYLARYREAIDHYSLALDSYPEEARLWRHRGHRYLTLRRITLAIADFERAAELIEGHPDRIEPDGLPNARNEPRSTLGTNIYYHLGLAHYLRGDWAPAIDAYRRCLELSKNPDMQVATAYWLVLALGRSSAVAPADADVPSNAEIEALLAAIDSGLDIIENHAYHRLLLAFKGVLELATILEEAAAGNPQAFATTAYGVATWQAIQGDSAAAEALWLEILEKGAWPSFSYLAAEAEVARIED